MKKIVIALMALFASIHISAQVNNGPENHIAMKRAEDSLRHIVNRGSTGLNGDELAAYKLAMRNKYGDKRGGEVATGKVKTGFTKPMCQDSWGSPDNLEKTAAGETWFYYRQRSALHFNQAGKLLRISDYKKG